MTAYDNASGEPGAPFSFIGPWVAEVPAAEIAARYTGWEPDLVSLLQTPNKASRYAIHVVHALGSFVADRVCIIGDAAHAMTPHLGLGGNQGIEDAYVLARLLAHPHTTASNLGELLHIYDSVRRPSSQEMARRSLAVGRAYAFLKPQISHSASLEEVSRYVLTSSRSLAEGDEASSGWTKAQSMLVELREL